MRISRVAVSAILFCAAAFSQEFRGTISGAVIDASGAGIAGAKVVATETHTGSKVQTVSEATGQYTLPFLAPGDYDLTASFQGFKEFVQKNIHVGSGDHPQIDIKMTVGEATQSVEVTADAPLVNAENATLGQAITTKEVEDLPLNGGTPMMLAQFSIGVIATGIPSLVHPFDSGGPAAMSIGGTSQQTSELLLDGSPDATWDGRQAYSPPRDAVQEVRTKAFDSDASFGHTGGGTLKQVMKTGTNSFHGTAWEYNQPNTLAANNFFNNRVGTPSPVTHFNQYGLTAGGPVYIPHVIKGKDKLFWFFAYEGLPDSQPNPTLLTVPTDAERHGDFSALLSLCSPATVGTTGCAYQLFDPNTAVATSSTAYTRSPFAGNIIPTNRLNAIALKYLSFYPEPNVTSGVGASGVNNYNSNVTTNDKYNNELGRIDYNMSDRSRIFGDIRRTGYSQDKNNYFNNAAEGSLLFRNNWGGTVDEVYTINPTTVMDVRGNFTRMAESHDLPSAGFDPTSLGFPSYVAGNAQHLQMPIISLSTFQNLGASGANQLPSQSLQLFADVVKVKGNHTLKFGTDLRQYNLNVQTFGNSTGTFSFNNSWVRGSNSASSTVAQGQDLAAFLLGLPSSGSYDQNPAASYYSHYYSGFIQDDWRVSRTLTLNLGVRYDHDTPYHEKWARTVNGFDNTVPNPIAGAAVAAYNKNPNTLIPAGSFAVPGGLTFASPSNTQVYSNNSNRISPRVGLAWSPAKLGGKTVIRAGVGMFVQPLTISSLSATGAYSTNPIQTQEGFSQSTQFVATNNNFINIANTLDNPFPTGIVAPAGAAAGLATFDGQTVSFLAPNQVNPYSLRWNLDIQHTVGSNTLFEIAYIGNHAVHLPITVTQLNMVPAQYLSTLPTRDVALNTTLTGTVPNPFAGLLPNASSLNGSTVALDQLLAPYPQYPVGIGSGSWSGSTGVLEYNNPAGSSYFESLNLRVQRRLSSGLTIIGNYIYSKLIEEMTWLNATDPAPEKRVSPIDHPHRIVFAGTYDLPVGAHRHYDLHSKVANSLLGGWVVSSTYMWQMGPPVVWMNGSTTTPGDYVYFGGAGALTVDPRQAGITASGAAIPAFNTSLFATSSTQAFAFHIRTFSTTFPNIRADNINNLDASLLKRFNFTESKYLQLRFEAYNLPNHPTFAAPNTQASSTSFGLITSQANRPRTIQVGARIVW
ncbi:MAG TPA: TonB-dependent receptor [Candidatus Limnocylindrales bacterium]|nr:TonB-dependent receptor [Candidatus Limnocylindrales bacterium]